MSINEAFSQFVESMEFKMIAKNKDTLGNRFRVYLSRHKAGKLRTGAMVEILEANGYEIKANKVTKKK